MLKSDSGQSKQKRLSVEQQRTTTHLSQTELELQTAIALANESHSIPLDREDALRYVRDKCVIVFTDVISTVKYGDITRSFYLSPCLSVEGQMFILPRNQPRPK